MINSELISRARAALEEADAILIGAGAGLSTAAGLHYAGKRFTENFQDFIDRYKLTDMYSSAFYPFETAEEKWAYFSRHIKVNRYDPGAFPLYEELLNFMQNKNYFVITTNADSQFYISGFEQSRIFATQGDYSLFQCQTPCHDSLYDNEEMVMKMVELQTNFKIPSELLPTCPVCGGPLVPHLRIDDRFVENADWKTANQHYRDFVSNAEGKNLVLLELGVGFNTPGIIRLPFENLTNAHPESTLIRINLDNVNPYYPIPKNSILIKGDIAQVLKLSLL